MFHYPRFTGSAFTAQGGVVDFYAKNHRALFAGMSKTKFTYQLSDHLPLWLLVNTDTTDEELDQIVNPKKT